jgi:hypothetical protein
MNQNSLPIELLDRESGATLGTLDNIEPNNGEFLIKATVAGGPSKIFPAATFLGSPGGIDNALQWLAQNIEGGPHHMSCPRYLV